MRDGGRYSYSAYGENAGTVEVNADSLQRRRERDRERPSAKNREPV
jgi:hypothetical protein